MPFLLCGSFSDYPKDAELAARGIQKRFSHPWEAAGITCRITASTAHMITDSLETDESHIIDQLEYTLSRARETDGNSLIFFDERLRENFEPNQYVLDQV